MKVNPKTLLFEDLTVDEKTELLRMAKEIIMEGKVPMISHIFVSTWLDAFQQNNTSENRENQFLLLISVCFPQRALLSLLLLL